MMRILCLIMFVGVTACPAVLARAVATKQSADHVRRALAFSMIAVTIAYNLYYFSPQIFQLSESLPLQVCDLLGIVASLALATRWRVARAILALSAIPFVSQAVLTPVGDLQITSLRSWLYWLFHGFIFAVFLFDVAVARFRPSARDLMSVFAVDVGYVASIGSLDAHFGWNYGYIGESKPDAATLIDLLGPWPARIFGMLALAVLLQTICFFMFKRRGPLT